MDFQEFKTAAGLRVRRESIKSGAAGGVFLVVILAKAGINKIGKSLTQPAR